MTYEEFYGDDLDKIKAAQRTLESMVETMKRDVDPKEDLQPVVYYCSRIKKPESMIRKLEGRGLPTTTESALTNVYDAVGIRIVCSFAGDVFNIVEKIENDPLLEVVEKKDYLSHPKPNGNHHRRE